MSTIKASILWDNHPYPNTLAAQNIFQISALFAWVLL